jgi:hypothetical protein
MSAEARASPVAARLKERVGGSPSPLRSSGSSGSPDAEKKEKKSRCLPGLLVNRLTTAPAGKGGSLRGQNSSPAGIEAPDEPEQPGRTQLAEDDAIFWQLPPDAAG